MSFNFKRVCYYYNLSDLLAFIQRQSAATCRSKQCEKVRTSLFEHFSINCSNCGGFMVLVAGNPCRNKASGALWCPFNYKTCLMARIICTVKWKLEYKQDNSLITYPRHFILWWVSRYFDSFMGQQEREISEKPQQTKGAVEIGPKISRCIYYWLNDDLNNLF